MGCETQEVELHPKQFAVYESTAQEILYGGSAGSGKSYLARILAITYAIQIPGLQVYFFRRHYADLIKNHMEGEAGFRALLASLVDAGICEIVKLEIRFSNGSRIFLNSCQHKDDVYKFQGVEIHFLMIDEATQFHEEMVRFLRSRVRLSEEMKKRIPKNVKEKFPFILYTANPGGVGHQYFKLNFVDKGDAIYKAPDSEGGFLRQFISARLNDNPSLDPIEYAKTLQGLKRPELVKAMLEGDWNVALGAFFTEFSDSLIIPDINIPPGVQTFGAFDWGYSAPAVLLFFAVSDGIEFPTKLEGSVYIPRGALVCYKELSFIAKENPSLGAQLSNEQMIKFMVSAGADKLPFIVTDSLPFQSRGGLKLAEEYRREGLKLIKGDDSRVTGWAQVRSRFIEQMIYFTKSCKYTIQTLPLLQTNDNNPEDCDTDGDDHWADCVRLACMTRPLVKKREIQQNEIKEAINVPKFGDLIEKHIRAQKRSAR